MATPWAGFGVARAAVEADVPVAPILCQTPGASDRISGDALFDAGSALTTPCGRPSTSPQTWPPKCSPSILAMANGGGAGTPTALVVALARRRGPRNGERPERRIASLPPPALQWRRALCGPRCRKEAASATGDAGPPRARPSPPRKGLLVRLGLSPGGVPEPEGGAGHESGG